MLDLFDESTQLIAALDERRVHYARAGGLAMAVWGYPRATVDIDLLVPSGHRPAAGGTVSVDMSAKAVTTRLRRVSQLRELCLSLMNAKPVAPKPKSG